MAENNIDDILVRLDEIEKLQTELGHLVPRLTSNSSVRASHRDLPRDLSASTRFPSLFTFPVISNLSSTSSKNERVQRSTAQMNLNSRLSSGNRLSTASLKNCEKLAKGGSSTRETNIFKDLLKSTSNVAKSYGSTLASTSSVANSRTSTMPHLTRSITANRPNPIRDSQETIKRELKSERLPNVASKTRNMSNARLNRKENNADTNTAGHSNSRGKNNEIRKRVVVPKKKPM